MLTILVWVTTPATFVTTVAGPGDPREIGWPLLITATPRSGTTYVGKYLRDHGLDVTHDWGPPGKHGTVSWIAWPYEPHDNYFGPVKLHNKTFRKAIHMMRNPLESITSLMETEPYTKPQYRSFISRHVALNRTNRALGLEFWVAWHSALFDFGYPFMKFEDFLNDAATRAMVFRAVNVTVPSVWRQLPMRVNSRPHRKPYTWHELSQFDKILTLKAQRLARRGGYHI